VVRLSSHSLNSFSAGSITNLLSNDASQIEMTLMFLNFLWVENEKGERGLYSHSSRFQLAPFDIFIVAYFFWQFVKYIAFIALAYTLALLLFNLIYGRLYAFLQ
jgi:hypothetical protein